MNSLNHTVQKIMKQCKSLRYKSSTSFFQLQKYLDFMLQTILERDNFFISCTPKLNKNDLFDKEFFSAFEYLSQLQQAKYYYHMVKIVYNHVNCKQPETKIKTSNIQNVDNKAKQYDADIIRKGFFHNPEASHTIQINTKRSVLLIKSQNNPYDLEFNIENYLVRQSKKNSLEKGRYQFVIRKSSKDSTPNEMRFSLKNVYQFPEMFDCLWDTMLESHTKKLLNILSQLSQQSSRRGHVQIVFLDRNNELNSERNSLKNFKVDSTQNPQSIQNYSVKHSQHDYLFLDINHPNTKIDQQNLKKLCIRQKQQQNHFLWGRQWQKTKKGQLKNINYEYIAVQRNAVKKIIKNFISMGNGQAQMPIQMFSNQSNTLQLAKACKYFPYFFIQKKQACFEKQTLIIDAFKKTFCSVIGFLLIRNRMQKPLQPLLGETYQGFIGGDPIYVQQIQKNKSYILFQTQQFKLYGSLELKTQISGLNSIKAGSKGYLTLQLKSIKKSPKIIFTIPMIQLGGLIYGDRLVEINDSSIMFEQQSNTFCYLKWGKNKKSFKQYQHLSSKQDFVQGSVIKLKQQKRFSIQNYLSNKDYIKDFIKQTNSQKKYIELYGNWTNQIFCDSIVDRRQSIFKVDQQKPYQLCHYIYSLPSDSRSRKDIRFIDSDNWTQANKQRKKCQESQIKSSILRLSKIKK